MAITQYKPYRLTKKVGQRSFRQLIPASPDTFEYVSLGDSICAGHAIDRGWYTYYNEAVQYNKKDINDNNRGNCLTTLLPNTYTALLQKELQRKMTDKKVNATSFGHSGATVDDLIEMLREGTEVAQAPGKINTTKTYCYGDNPMTEALRRADLVTISIGANAFLTPGMDYIEGKIQEYLFEGTEAEGFSDLKEVFNTAIGTLGGNGAGSASIPALGKTYSYFYSYLDLIETLYLVNPNAVYRFTTVHNPFRCFYLDDKFIRSFFYAISKVVSIFSKEVADIVCDTIENSIQWKTVQENAGYLSPWVGGNIDKMNNKLDEAIAIFTKNNKWDITSTPVKAIFDAVPDRPGAGEIKYNNLINVQITRDYFGTDFDWGALWENQELETTGVGSYFKKFVEPYFNPDLTVKGDLNEMFQTIIEHVATYILKYNMDPHPQNAGHEVIYRIFSDSVSDLYGTTTLNKITYEPNGGTGTAHVQKFVAKLSNADNKDKEIATITRANGFGPQSGYRFIGWSTSSGEKSPTVPNASEQIFSGDVSLYSQWSNQCIIKFKHSNHTGQVTDDIMSMIGMNWSGHSECYALYINGIEMPDFAGFNTSQTSYEDIYSVPYGADLVINVKNYIGDSSIGIPGTDINLSSLYQNANCHVYVNGTDVSGWEGSRQDLRYAISATCDMEIDFRWFIEGTLAGAFYGGTKAKSWENCYITTFDASYSTLKQPYTITFNPGIGSGSMTTQKVLQFGSNVVKTTLPLVSYSLPDVGYRFTNWSTGHSNGQLITMSGNLALTAQWSNARTIVFTKSLNDWGRLHFGTIGGGVTGNTGQQIYKCQYQDINGNWQDIDKCYGNFGNSNNNEVGRKDLPYGTNIRVTVKHTRGDYKTIPIVGTKVYEYEYADCYIHMHETINGSLVHTYTKTGGEISYDFPLTQNTIIDFWYDITNTPWTGGHLKWDAYIFQLGS